MKIFLAPSSGTASTNSCQTPNYSAWSATHGKLVERRALRCVLSGMEIWIITDASCQIKKEKRCLRNRSLCQHLFYISQLQTISKRLAIAIFVIVESFVLIFGLLKQAVSSSYYTILGSNSGLDRIQKGIGVVWNYYPSICRRTEENHGKLQSAESIPGRNFIPGHPEKETRTKNIRTMFRYKKYVWHASIAFRNPSSNKTLYYQL